MENNFSVSDTISQSSKSSIQFDKIKDIPKKKIHPLIFILNILWMLFCCHCTIYYVFGPHKQIQMKGKLAGISLGVNAVIALPTFFYITTLKSIFQLFGLIDTIMVVTFAAAIAFVNLILLFDKTDDWYWTMIEASFSISLVFYSTMVRVLLVHLDWQKWQLIVFKVHILINSMMFFLSGVYFIWVDFTYTYHKLPEFDSNVHQFMVLFIFTMFSYTFQLYAKTSDLDHTGDLRYNYRIKNFDETLPKKKNQIIRKKRESIQSIKMLTQNQLQQIVGPYKISRFSKIYGFNN